MARDSSNPPLLVRSERGTPMWMSPLEVMKLSIGLADFTCCQRNHIITTETQKVMNSGKYTNDDIMRGLLKFKLVDPKDWMSKKKPTKKRKVTKNIRDFFEALK